MEQKYAEKEVTCDMTYNFNVSNIFECRWNNHDVSYEKAYMATETDEQFTEMLDHINKYNDNHSQRFSLKSSKKLFSKSWKRKKNKSYVTSITLHVMLHFSIRLLWMYKKRCKLVIRETTCFRRSHRKCWKFKRMYYPINNQWFCTQWFRQTGWGDKLFQAIGWRKKLVKKLFQIIGWSNEWFWQTGWCNNWLQKNWLWQEVIQKSIQGVIQR